VILKRATMNNNIIPEATKRTSLSVNLNSRAKWWTFVAALEDEVDTVLDLAWAALAQQ